MPSRGNFITLEGGEGAGKSTQISLLYERLGQEQISAIKTREPGGPVRDLLVNGSAQWHPRAEALLHYAARAEHLAGVILPALDHGTWVVCDRFADSTMAYQGIVQGAGVDFVAALYALVVEDNGPDLTLILDLPPEVGLQRTQGRGQGEDRYERMGLEFHQKLREAFRHIANQAPERCVIINADQKPEQVAADIWDAVRHKLDVDP